MASRIEEAIENIKNGVVEGFEDFYLLTYQDTYMDIHSTSSDEVYIWEIVKRVYKDVWNHADKIPSAALTREWMRTVIEKVSIEYNPRKPITEFKDFDGMVHHSRLEEKAETILISIEDELGFLNPEIEDEMGPLEKLVIGEEETSTSQGEKKKGDRRAMIALLAGTVLVTAASIAIIKLFPNQSSTASTNTTLATVATSGGKSETKVDPQQPVFGWNQYTQGWRYRKPEGHFVTDNWLDDKGQLYYFDDTGYMVTGEKQIGEQIFTFSDRGALERINRDYSLEINDTDLGRQLEQYGLTDQKNHIIDESIVKNGEWNYFLMQEGNNQYPDLMRLKEGENRLELISDQVRGYVIVGDNVWYCKDDKMLYFVSSNEATIQGTEAAQTTPETTAAAAAGAVDTALVREENNQYILKDASGNPESGSTKQIGTRIYNLDAGKITTVSRIPTRVGNMQVMKSNVKMDNNIYTLDGQKYLTQGQWITDMCVANNDLYYATVVRFDAAKIPISQIYKVDLTNKKKTKLTGQFKGKVDTMYYYPENASVMVEYSDADGNENYGKLAAYSIGEGTLSSINDDTQRAAKGSPANSKVKMIISEGNLLYCYLQDATKSQTLVLDINQKSPMPMVGD